MGILQEGSLVLLLQVALLVVSSAHCGVEIALGRSDTLDLEVLEVAGRRTDRNPGATDSSTQCPAIVGGDDTMAEPVEFHW
jgi:hypothetical protein